VDEAATIIRPLLAGEEVTHDGEHYSVKALTLRPGPVQQRRPILIGGGGERKTLRLVAQYADACNLFAYDPSALTHKLSVLREHCDAVGRQFAEIEKTSLGHVHVTRDGRHGSLTPAAAVEYFHGLAELGIDHGIVSLRGVENEDTFDVLGTDVIPAVEKIPVAGR
jgi:alkanesulfonate monooxygenase SsuD/methylene tetrahydromethanopterin reductase-like flavin-dependent oxidoreductase (luciferase family)